MSLSELAENVRLRRDRPTWLLYLQLATFGSYLYMMSAAVPLLQREQGTSQAVAGLHGTAMAIGAIVAGLGLPRLVRARGRRFTVWLGLAGVCLGVGVLAVGRTLPLTLAAAAISSGFGCLTLYAGSAALSDHHGRAGPAAISEANALVAVAGIGGSFAFSTLAQSWLGWRTALVIPILLTVVVAVSFRGTWMEPSTTDAVGPQPRGGPLGWRFRLAAGVLFSCVAFEFTMNLWTASLLADRVDLTPEAAASGLTAFTLGIAAGRFGGARLALRMNVAALFIAAIVVSAAGWLVVWTSTVAALSYAGLVLCGLGIALQFPLAVFRMIEASGGRPDRASAIGSTTSGLAIGVGPFVLGALGDAFGTHSAFLLVPVLQAVAIAGIVVSVRRR